MRRVHSAPNIGCATGRPMPKSASASAFHLTMPQKKLIVHIRKRKAFITTRIHDMQLAYSIASMHSPVDADVIASIVLMYIGEEEDKRERISYVCAFVAVFLIIRNL